MDLKPFTGPKAFGAAYRIVLENDPHAAGSVDREILSGMIRLCRETAPYLYDGYSDLTACYPAGSRPFLEWLLTNAGLPVGDPERRVARIAELTRSLDREVDFPRRRVIRNEIRRNGRSDHRKGHGLVHRRGAGRLRAVSGCRLPEPHRESTFNLDAAYSGHVIVEDHRLGAWGAVDTNSAVVYLDETTDGLQRRGT